MLGKGFVHWSWITPAGLDGVKRRQGRRGRGGMRVPSESVPFWFAVPEGEDGVWPNLLLPHGHVLQGAPEGEVPAGGLHGGAEWQLQVRSPVQLRGTLRCFVHGAGCRGARLPSDSQRESAIA